MTFVNEFLQALANPLIISILLAVSVPAILIELKAPGGWFAGFVGVVCLALALFGLGQLTVNWLGFGLIVIAFVLFILEVKTPSTGPLALAGAGTMLAGLLVLFNTTGAEGARRLSVPAAVSITAVTAAFFVFIMAKALRARHLEPLTGADTLIGATGAVREIGDIPTEGMYRGLALVNGELWQVKTKAPLKPGEKVVVKGVEGITLRVASLE